jgi:hypothetical protein
MFTLLISLIYFLIGAGVKYVDAAYDDHTFSRRYTIPLGMALGTMAGLMMIWDHVTLIIFLSLIIGVAVTRKLDILPFQVLAGIAVLLPVCYFHASLPFSGTDWKLILLISFGATIDEIGNDLADAKVLKKIIGTFFLYRGYLKVFIALIAFIKYLPLMYVVAFLSFDLGYLLFVRLSARRQAKLLYSYPLPNTNG